MFGRREKKVGKLLSLWAMKFSGKKNTYIYLCIKTPRPSSIFVFVFHFNCFTHESLKKAQHFFFLKKKG